MSKYLKLFSSLTFCLIPAAIIIYFAIPWNPINTISLVGSSSLQPLLTEFANQYKDSDLILQGGGSGFGIKSVAINTADIGLASKDPYETVKNATYEKNGFTKKEWENNNIKTFTIAFDNIGIIYKTIDNNDKKLNIDQDNIKQIYEIFSGTTSFQINEIISGSSDTNSFTAYARTGGSNASGTATAFANQFNGDSSQYLDEQDDEIKNILKSGSYKGNVRSTNESNVETWNKISDENLDGGITYLSLSFILQNYETINAKGYEVANVNGVDPIKEYQSNNNSLNINFLQKYKWFTVYNLMLSISNTADKIKDFINWIYFDQNAKNIIDELALVSIDDSDFLKSMLISYQDNDDLNELEITQNNFNDYFFNSIYSDVQRINDEEWPEEWGFGITNQTILYKDN